MARRAWPRANVRALHNRSKPRYLRAPNGSPSHCVESRRRPWSYRGTLDHGRRRDSTQRSEEHTSELQSHSDLVCRLLLEKKKKKKTYMKQNTRHNSET